jgi:hypothetical protein
MHIPDQMGGSSNDAAQGTGMPAANPIQEHWIKCPVCPAGAEKYPDIDELRSHVIISGHNYIEPPFNAVLSVSSLGVMEDATEASRKCKD